MHVETESVPERVRVRALNRPLAGGRVLIVVKDGPQVLAGVVLVPLADGDGRVGEVRGGRGEGNDGHL